MKILAIKTNEGFLITCESRILTDLLFDRLKPEPTYKPKWFKIKSKPILIERVIPGGKINQRYVIRPEYTSMNLRPVWNSNEIYDEDGDIDAEFDNFKGCYDYISDTIDPGFESVDFEWDEFLSIEIFKDPTKFSYNISSKPVPQPVTEKSVKYDILTEIITPDILLHTQPCKLSSKETYDIIRQFIKENINNKTAEIIADYDFCFAVAKRIPLATPYTYQVDTGTTKRPKYETRLVEKRALKVFNMTHTSTNNGQGYRDYQCVTPFAANSIGELKETIDQFLNELINVINEPVCECSTCNGSGVLFNKV